MKKSSRQLFMHHQNAGELLELMAAYQKSEILFSFAELEISNLLKSEELSARQIAGRLKINALAMERFLNACVAVGLLKKKRTNTPTPRSLCSFPSKMRNFISAGKLPDIEKEVCRRGQS